MVNGMMEEIQEGEGGHQCFQVYWHDMPFTEGTNVWVQYTWDKSANLFRNHCLLHMLSYNNGCRLEQHF
jgi:hypothetical protein